MRIAATFLLVLVVSACASTGADPSLEEAGGASPGIVGATNTGEMALGTLTVRIDPETHARLAVVPFDRDSLWSSLIRVYQDDLEIPVETMVSARYLLGNTRFVHSGRLGGERMSAYFRCGTTQTGEAADQYRVSMSVQSQLSPTDGGTEVRTLVSATAEDPFNGQTVACASTGELEERILEELMVRVSI